MTPERYEEIKGQAMLRSEAMPLVLRFHNKARVTIGLVPERHCQFNGIDARFILNAPDYVTELLALVDEQAAEIERQKELVEHFRDWCAAPCECEMPPDELVEVEGVPV